MVALAMEPSQLSAMLSSSGSSSPGTGERSPEGPAQENPITNGFYLPGDQAHSTRCTHNTPASYGLGGECRELKTITTEANWHRLEKRIQKRKRSG